MKIYLMNINKLQKKINNKDKKNKNYIKRGTVRERERSILENRENQFLVGKKKVVK